MLAVLLQVLGSPMAWSHWLAADLPTAGHVSTDTGTAACHGDETPAPMSCCEGGDCTCAAPALLVIVTAQPVNAGPVLLDAPLDTSALPSRPLDDALRPPIR
jgi:hypothetical protein